VKSPLGAILGRFVERPQWIELIYQGWFERSPILHFASNDDDTRGCLVFLSCLQKRRDKENGEEARGEVVNLQAVALVTRWS